MKLVPGSSRAIVGSKHFPACTRSGRIPIVVSLLASALVALAIMASAASAATPCDSATHPEQCGWFDAGTLPPFVQDAIQAKGGTFGPGNVLVLTSGDPADADSEISNDVSQLGCGTNPDGWETYDCVLLDSFVPPEDSVVLAVSSEWFEWYQTIFTDWMTISGAGVQTVDVSINSWIDNKVDILPYGPMDTGAVILTSLSAEKMVNFRVADSGDHIYDTAIVVAPATWFGPLGSSNDDPTLLCGNGELEPGEECDDSNLVGDDDCSNLCLGTQQPPSTPPSETTCGNLHYSWPNGTTLPYTCGADLCAGYRCVVSDTISPACYTAGQCAEACTGSCVDVQTAELDCSTMCTVQPPATEPSPVLPQTCDELVYSWEDGATMPYSCDDDCHGQRCVTGSTISTECFKGSDCNETTCPDGVCVDTPADDCTALCDSAVLPADCSEAEIGQSRMAANQSGACLGNVEVCETSLQWRLDDNSYSLDDEQCNGIDDDCNGAVDDMYVTCGDFGLCQNTVNACDPANPTVPVVCNPLPAPSPVEICNNGLDDDCEGDIDDGCECGDDQCMPGETYANCPADCPAPANYTGCDDGDFCTEGDYWLAGTCQPGTPVVCDSGSACVIDGACDSATGCSATKVNCEDAIACTADSCDAATGCVNDPVDSECEDGDPCTIDTCDAAVGCLSAPDPGCNPDADGDGYAADVDCNDANDAVNPGAAELCNAVDDDCDATIDDGFNVGSACQSLPNACGSTASGTIACAADGLSSACDASAPSNPAGYGDACASDPNACGATAAGTIGCDGTCDATIPANPAGYGDACASDPNVCGSTGAGTIGCDGTCSAATPPAIDGDADGTADCVDGCPSDAGKIEPGVCGCGTADVDTNGNGVTDCQEPGRADLAAAVQVMNATPRAGRPLRFRLEVTNLGPNRAEPEATIAAAVTGAVRELRLPAGCTGDASAITCVTGEIAAGRRKAKTIRLVADAGTNLTVTASVSSPVVDPNAANQTATTMVTVVP